MAFAELRTFFDPALVLPIGDKEYRIPQPNAEAGLRIKQLFAAKILSSATELEHIMELFGAEWVPDIQQVPVLNPITGEPVVDDDGNPVTEEQDHGMWSGGVWSEMVADGVSWEEMMHAGRTALMDIGMGRVVAEQHWVDGIVPTLDIDFEDIDGQIPDDSGNPRPAEPEPNRAARRAAAKKGKKKSGKR